MAKLKVVAGEHIAQEYMLGPEAAIIGRRKSNAIVIDNEKVSRSHAQIVFRNGFYYLSDMGSVNGTLVNGIKISAEHTLSPGDEISVGGVVFRYFAEIVPITDIYVPGYTIKELLAQGGMGTVYRAMQNSMEREVALKVLHDQYAERAEFVQRFVQEARSAGKLNHPNVIGVHDVGKAGSTYYFSMELVEGNDLSQVMSTRTMEYPEVMSIGANVADALDYAHSSGIVHRDIKPDNIMLAPNGAVKLADLGIAKIFDVGSGAGADLTKQGKVLGTPHYMSPEQATGMSVDGRSDIYSLGATLYHILAERPPFDGESNQDIMLKHVNETAPALDTFYPTLPTAVVNVLEKMMAKKAEDRFSTAAEAREAMKEAAQAKPRPKPAGAVKKTTKGTKAGMTKKATRVGKKRTTGKNDVADASMTKKVGIFAGVLVLALILFALVGGDEPTEQKQAKGPVATDILRKAAGREAMDDLNGALALYKKVMRDFPRDMVSYQKAKKRVAVIKKKQSERDEDKKGLKAWKSYQAWELKNKDSHDEQVNRLSALIKEYPRQEKLFRTRIDEIVKARNAQVEKAIQEDFLKVRKLAMEAPTSKRFDEALDAVNGFTQRYPESRQAGELKELTEVFQKDLRKNHADLQKQVNAYLNAKPRKYGSAIKICQNWLDKIQAISYKPSVETTLQKIKTAMEFHEKELLQRAQMDMLAMKFSRARKSLDQASLAFDGTEIGKRLPKRISAVNRLERLHLTVIKKINEAGIMQTDIKVASYEDGRKSLKIMGASKDGVKVPLPGSGGAAVTTVRWNKLKAEEILRIYRTFVDPKMTKLFAAIFKVDGN